MRDRILEGAGAIFHGFNLNFRGLERHFTRVGGNFPRVETNKTVALGHFGRSRAIFEVPIKQCEVPGTIAEVQIEDPKDSTNRDEGSRRISMGLDESRSALHSGRTTTTD